MHITPTSEAYSELQDAFDHFNEELFGGALPPVLLSIRKHRNARGYFSPDRFTRRDDESRTDEIALDATLFDQRSVEESLSTLAHEMAHLWQHRFGQPGRRGYHNRQWGRKMKEIGLHPSDTGLPGGRETGQRVTHYIVEGGPFALSAARLIERGFTLSWADKTEEGRGLSGKRLKFTCPSCRDAAWGRDSLRLICAKCDFPMAVAA